MGEETFPEYKNVLRIWFDWIPDDDKYSMKSVKEWIKESKEQVRFQ